MYFACKNRVFYSYCKILFTHEAKSVTCLCTLFWSIFGGKRHTLKLMKCTSSDGGKKHVAESASSSSSHSVPTYTIKKYYSIEFAGKIVDKCVSYCIKCCTRTFEFNSLKMFSPLLTHTHTPTHIPYKVISWLILGR